MKGKECPNCKTLKAKHEKEIRDLNAEIAEVIGDKLDNEREMQSRIEKLVSQLQEDAEKMSRGDYEGAVAEQDGCLWAIGKIEKAFPEVFQEEDKDLIKRGFRPVGTTWIKVSKPKPRAKRKSSFWDAFWGLK